MKTQILYPQSQTILPQEKVVAIARPKAAARLLYIDNLRIFLTILVILHHLMNIYAASGGWIYQEGRQDMITALLGKWFTVVNQSYFMGLFLLISAYFVPSSIERKGVWRFVKDRLVRLGIPLAVYSWLVRPLLIYAALTGNDQLSQPVHEWYLMHYFKEYPILGGGPLWFISALLIFSLIYALVRWLLPEPLSKPLETTSFPANWVIALFAGGVGLVSFMVRIWSPSDKVFIPLGFQFADFPQYIALFIVGLVACRRNWLGQIPLKTGKLCLIISILLILAWPVIIISLNVFDDVTPFLGGWHWQSLVSALWQSFLGISMCVTMVHLFRHYLDRQGALSRFLSPNAYTAYLIHEPVITFVAVAVMGVVVYPLLKFGLMALITIPLIFGLSSLIRKLPFTANIL